MALSEQKILMLKQRCNSISMARLLEIIDQNPGLYPSSLPTLSAERRRLVEEHLAARPSAAAAPQVGATPQQPVTPASHAASSQSPTPPPSTPAMPPSAPASPRATGSLDPERKKLLRQQCNKMPIERILELIDNGSIVYPDDLPTLNADRKQRVEQHIASRPNPVELQEWNALLPRYNEASDAVRLMFANYVAHWEQLLPNGNHVGQAKARIAQIDEEIRQRTAAIEESEWQALDRQDIDALTGHLTKYPHTLHRDEIDDLLWVLISKEGRLELLTVYTTHFPEGLHATQAVQAETAWKDWSDLATDGNLEELATYIEDNPGSPFIEAARQRIEELKPLEMQRMIEQWTNYPAEDLSAYIKKQIFTKEELLANGICNETTYAILNDLDTVKDNLPDVNDEIRRCRKECAQNHTDVFFFGIPSTGKTCILMGLTGAREISINSVLSGGPYAMVLDQYLRSGLTIGQTPKDFVATIEAEIHEQKGIHHLNLVEMAGEDFAFKIADNEEGIISFEDIGAGATQLLLNDNKKVFFIIVDPTAAAVRFNHLVTQTDEYGVERTYLVNRSVNQRVILHRLVSLLGLPENSSILDNVEYINIIVTKADVLGYGPEREQRAVEKFMNEHGNIVESLTRLCLAHNINRETKGVPMLYTFSLGQFFAGGIFQYNPADANRLVTWLREKTPITPGPSFMNKMRSLLH